VVAQEEHSAIHEAPPVAISREESNQ
jgi:hypothetical protein